MNVKDIEVTYEVVSPSEVAYQKSKEFKRKHYLIIHKCLLTYGELNCEQIADKTCLDRYQIGRRMKEMVLMEVVKITCKRQYNGKLLTNYDLI